MTHSTEATIGAAVAYHRKRQGLRQADLAERLSRLGDGSLGDSQVVSKIERGLRGVGLDEWLLLASALLVPPLALLFPYESSGIVTPHGDTISPHWGWQWATGEEAGPGPVVYGDTGWREGSWRTNRQRQIAKTWQRLVRDMNKDAALIDHDDSDEAYDRRAAALAEIAELQTQANHFDMPDVLRFQDDSLNEEAADLASLPADTAAARNIRRRIAERALREAFDALTAAQRRYEAASNRLTELRELEDGR